MPLGPPPGLAGNHVTQTSETAWLSGDLTQGYPGQFFTSDGPPVVKQDSPTLIENGLHILQPAGTQFGIQGDEHIVIIEVLHLGVGEVTQLRQNGAGVFGQDSVVADDLFGELIQGCGVHRHSGATAGRTEGHAHTFPACDRLNGFVDEGISLGLIRNLVRQFTEGTTADGFAFAGA